jgi:PTS system ascorbate-specific IIA component
MGGKGHMVSTFLTEGRVAADVECNTWRDAVRACGNLLVNEGDVDPPFIDSMIHTVEELGPYMILLPKIAFFHGRPSKDVHRNCLSMITLKEPVIFEEFEGQVINCAFGFGAVDNESHVNLLTDVAKLLQDGEFVELVCNNGCREDIFRILAKY